MTPKQVRMMVLELAVEDFIGLWEIVWRAQTIDQATGSKTPESELRSEVLRLLSAGLVALYDGIRFNGDEVELNADMAHLVLADPSNWLPAESGRRHYRLAATKKGFFAVSNG